MGGVEAQDEDDDREDQDRSPVSSRPFPKSSNPIEAAFPMGRCGQYRGGDVAFGDGVAVQFLHDMPAREDHDPVGQARDFLRVRGNDDNRGSLARHLAKHLVNLAPRADIDALRRLVDQDHFWPVRQYARHCQLLLVST